MSVWGMETSDYPSKACPKLCRPFALSIADFLASNDMYCPFSPPRAWSVPGPSLVKVPLKRFHLNGKTIRFHPQTQMSEQVCTA